MQALEFAVQPLGAKMLGAAQLQKDILVFGSDLALWQILTNVAL